MRGATRSLPVTTNCLAGSATAVDPLAPVIHIGSTPVGAGGGVTTVGAGVGATKLPGGTGLGTAPVA